MYVCMYVCIYVCMNKALGPCRGRRPFSPERSRPAASPPMQVRSGQVRSDGSGQVGREYGRSHRGVLQVAQDVHLSVCALRVGAIFEDALHQLDRHRAVSRPNTTKDAYTTQSQSQSQEDEVILISYVCTYVCMV